MRLRCFVTLLLALLLPAGAAMAQGKGSQGKSPEKKEVKAEKTEKKDAETKDAKKQEAKAKAGSEGNRGGETRGTDRARDAQQQGQGADQRGFDTPKGLDKDKKDGDAAKGAKSKDDKDGKREVKAGAREEKKDAKKEDKAAGKSKSGKKGGN